MYLMFVKNPSLVIKFVQFENFLIVRGGSEVVQDFKGVKPQFVRHFGKICKMKMEKLYLVC